MRRLRVYISGPYSSNPEENTKIACGYWQILWEMGYAPQCPHWSHIQTRVSDLPHSKWLEYDCSWISANDVVLRIPGESDGAEIEVAYANLIKVPVVHSLGELNEQFPAVEVYDGAPITSTTNPV